MKKVATLCCMVVTTLSAVAASISLNGYTWTYSVDGEKTTAWVVRPSPKGELEIPSSLADVPLSAIGEFLFQGCDSLVSVTIPDSIEEIGESAFAECSSLLHVELPSSIGTLTVGANAFDATTIVDVETRYGYAFCWTNATGEVVADPFHSETSVTVSPCWTRNLPWLFSEGLVAHYTFDGDANDDSGNGNDGILYDVTPTLGRHGNADGAYKFNGTSAYIEVPDSESLRDITQSFTISSWVKPEAWYNDWVSIVCKGYATKSRQYGAQIEKTGGWVINCYSGTKCNQITTKGIELGKWSHVSVTYEPTLIIVYLNGEILGSMTPLGSIQINTEPLYIGLDHAGDVEYLNGDMDEVRIYNRALSSEEIRALANGDNPTVTVIGENTSVYHYDVGDGVGIVQTSIGMADSDLTIPATIGGKCVVSIGSYAFADCNDIEFLTIPSSVAEIGDYAFMGCGNLSEVRLSGEIGTLTIKGNAFAAATKVSLVDRPGYEFVCWTNEFGHIESDPFHSASAITVTPVWQKIATATIDGYTWTFAVSGEGLATIGNGKDIAIAPAPIGDLTIPEGFGGYPVTRIGEHAFAGCEGLTSITIPERVTSVGLGAFDGCSGLTNVVIESESFDCTTPGLMQAKFDTRFDIISPIYDSNEVSLVSGAIAAYTLVTAAPWEFSDPVKGKTYAWNNRDSTFAYGGQMYMVAGKTYVFGVHFDDDVYVSVDGGTIINKWSSSGDSTYSQKVHTGKFICSSTGWHDVEFRFGDLSGAKGSWGNVWGADFGAGYRDDGSTTTAQSGWSRLLDPGDGSLFRCSGLRTVFAGCSNIVSVTMPWPLVSRMSTVFPDAYTNIAAVTLTGETDSIPEKAFAGCKSLNTIDIPDSVTNIGYAAFTRCSGLTKISLPFVGSMRGNTGTIDSLFGYVFGRDSYEGGTATQQYYTSKDSATFYIPDSLTNVVLTSETQIGYGAFWNCAGISRIAIPSSVKSMGFRAFKYANHVRIVEVDSIEAWCDVTFGSEAGNPLISGGFISTNGVPIVDLVIPDGVKRINKYAFIADSTQPSQLRSVRLPGSVEEVGYCAFSVAPVLQDVIVANDVRSMSIDAGAFNAPNATFKVVDKEGYSFGGWTNAIGVVVDDPFRSATAVTVSPWWKKIVNLAFNANGGIGEMQDQVLIEGDALDLGEISLLRSGYSLLGWSDSESGNVVYEVGASILNVPASMDGVTLSAQWKPNTPTILPASDTAFTQASTTVVLSHEADDVAILYTVDGSDPVENGREYRGEFSVYVSCTVRAVTFGAGRYSDEVSVVLTRQDNLGEAANLYGYLLETGWENAWTVDYEVSHDGVSSLRSGGIDNNGTTYLAAAIRKAGMVSFWWRAQCEAPEEEDGETYWYDYGSFYVDDVLKAKIAGHDTGWQFVSVEVPNGGKHVLRWEYSKDGATSYQPDCIWVDQVQWVPADDSGYTLTTPEHVPYVWLKKYGFDGKENDFETAAGALSGKTQGGKATKIWEEFVAGTDPTNETSVLTAKIDIQDGVPVVTWEPNLNTNSIERLYKVYGKETLSSTEEWAYPTNSLHRFFKVTVEMP